jgi:WD40 repeat protein/class 3 adenylate cyclase
MTRNADQPVDDQGLPVGFTLRRVLRGAEAEISHVAWSSDGELLAAVARDHTVLLWNTETGKLSTSLTGRAADVTSLAWSPESRLALGSPDCSIRVWDVRNQKHLILKLRASNYGGDVSALAWSSDAQTLVSASSGFIRVWNTKCANREFRLVSEVDVEGKATALACSPRGTIASGSSRGIVGLLRIKGRGGDTRPIGQHAGDVTSLAWSPSDLVFASGSLDRTIRIWDAVSRSELRILEGHTNSVVSIAFSCDGRLMASKSLDGTVRLWRCDSWDQIAVLQEPVSHSIRAAIAFHPAKSTLASLGEGGRVVRVWDLDVGALLAVRQVTSTVQYRNAKVVLVGDTGVGKSGLALVLTGQPFVPTDSTHARRVWTFDSAEIDSDELRKESRETLLWDLAGQPGYRLIHQLHLNEVAVAIVVFDSRSDTDPFSGVRHWDRALRQAHRVQGNDAAPTSLRKFLVAARTDRGGISVSRGRLQALVRELAFDGFFETSARELRGIPELASAIREAIAWELMPQVKSNDLFRRIKDFLLHEKESGRLLSTREDLYLAFVAHDGFGLNATKTEDLRRQFDTCVGRLESTGLIRRLSFGNLVLLQPELLDVYASAMVNAAKSEPEGLGSIVEEDARLGRFYIPQGERLVDREQERLVLVATVEDLLRYEIALRESSDEAPLLVFPSQFTRENPDLPDPKGKAIIFAFQGPITNIYTTLAVRLSHSGIFKRKEMWRNAATYTASVGGTCGLFLREVDEGRAELTLFFDDGPSEETRFQFEEYVRIHLERRSLNESLKRRRIFECENHKCKTPVTDLQATRRREFGFDWITCNVCGERVSLTDPKEFTKERTQQGVFEMDRSADALRDFEASMISAAAETETSDFKAWAGASKSTLALVFTDVVSSTQLGIEMGDERMNEVREAHFRQARVLLKKFDGYEIKTIGDAFMVAFHRSVEALNFALALSAQTGHHLVRIRAGIHVGPVRISEEDAFGNVVNFAARVVSSASGAEIWLSDESKKHIEQEKATAHEHLRWEQHPGCKLKGFPNTYTLWSIR